MVEVTQADRDAAAAYYYSAGGSPNVARDIREGRKDSWFRVQAFARHRIAAAQAERAAVVEWLRKLAGVPASALEGHPPRGEVWVLHRSADAIEAGEHRA